MIGNYSPSPRPTKPTSPNEAPPLDIGEPAIDLTLSKILSEPIVDVTPPLRYATAFFVCTVSNLHL